MGRERKQMGIMIGCHVERLRRAVRLQRAVVLGLVTLVTPARVATEDPGSHAIRSTCCNSAGARRRRWTSSGTEPVTIAPTDAAQASRAESFRPRRRFHTVTSDCTQPSMTAPLSGLHFAQ